MPKDDPCMSCGGGRGYLPRKGCLQMSNHYVPQDEEVRSDGPARFHDFPAEDFPIIIRYYSTDTDDLLYEQRVEGPGAIRVPGRAFFGQQVEVEVIYNTGLAFKSGPNGY